MSVTEQISCCVRKSEQERDSPYETERRKGHQAEELIFAEVDAVTCREQQQREIVADNRLWVEEKRDCKIFTPSPPFSLRGGETEDACSTSRSQGTKRL